MILGSTKQSFDKSLKKSMMTVVPDPDALMDEQYADAYRPSINNSVGERDLSDDLLAQIDSY